jgi:hypothetical protein
MEEQYELHKWNRKFAAGIEFYNLDIHEAGYGCD